jgi:hypothetical protein
MAHLFDAATMKTRMVATIRPGRVLKSALKVRQLIFLLQVGLCRFKMST